jgi:hypothetical protein
MFAKVFTRLSLLLALTCTGCHASSNPADPSGPSAISSPLPHSADSLSWIQFNDSAEGAFSMDVPYGFQVRGGMWRFGYFDVRWGMNIRSLDGKLFIRINDPNVPPYVLPGPHTGRAGQPYFKPQQMQMMVSNFEQAQPYAERYARRTFQGVCTSLTQRASAWTPAMPTQWQADPRAQVSQASIAYDCTTSDGPRIAEIYVRTNMPPVNNGLWLADPVISILATSENLPLAHGIVNHMTASWQKSQQWQHYQDRMTQMGLDQIRANFGQFMRQMQVYHQQREAAMNAQVAGFEHRQNAQAAQVSSFCDTLTGLTNLDDPQTGTSFQVFSGPNSSYYTNGAGQTVNSNVSPGPGFHQVEVSGKQ